MEDRPYQRRSHRQEHRVARVAQTQLPLPDARFKAFAYQELDEQEQYIALTLGKIDDPQGEVPLVRLHSADIIGSQRCDCQAQLHASLRAMVAEGRGILISMPQEGRGIGLTAKLHAYALQDQGFATVEANEMRGYPSDARSYRVAIEILKDLNVVHARLLTNNPQKIQALTDAGIDVERVPLEIRPPSDNVRYSRQSVSAWDTCSHHLTFCREPYNFYSS